MSNTSRTRRNRPKQLDIGQFVSCWYCRLDMEYGYEYCLKCQTKDAKHEHDWYNISIENIPCKRCWTCGKTEKKEGKSKKVC